MSDNTMVLPGDIPGLLRRGSPVLLPDGSSMTVHRFGDGGAWGASGFGRFVNGTLNGADMGGLRLDLTDPTGRAHAAWWVLDMPPNTDASVPGTAGGHFMRTVVLAKAAAGREIREDEILLLRALVLRLAGRTA